MELFKIRGIDDRDVTNIINKFTNHGFSVMRRGEMAINVGNIRDMYDFNLGDTMTKIELVLKSENYDYHRNFNVDGCEYYAIYYCSKRYDTLYDRCRFEDMSYDSCRVKNTLNSYYGAYVDTDTAALRQAFIRIIDKSFKMYSGIERATGKFKTTVVWGDGHKETVTATKPVKGYTEVMIFAYALAKRKFRTNSHFKKYVDNHTEEFGEFYIFYDEATYRQATVKKTDKKYDIYDMAALSIAVMEYGDIKKLQELVEEATK